MPALVACRFIPDLKAKYDLLIKPGKPSRVAITAIIRKLLMLPNALRRRSRKRTQSPLDQNGYSS